MQPVFDAATHVASEIARARDHLTVLENALAGMRPLLAPQEQERIQRMVGYAPQPRALKPSDVEVVEPGSRLTLSPPVSASAPLEINTLAAEEFSRESPEEATVAKAMPSASSEAGGAKVTRAYVRKIKVDAPTREPRANKASALGNVSRAAEKDGLPKTGGQFWLDCMGKGKQTLPEIVQKAKEKLDLDEVAVDVMRNRLSAWLYPAVKAGKLTASVDKSGGKQYQAARS